MTFWHESVSGERPVTILNEEGEVEITSIEALFERYAESAEILPSGVELVRPLGLKALTLGSTLEDPMKHMSPMQKKAYKLRYNDHLSTEEIAAQISSPHVYQLLHRAREKAESPGLVNVGAWKPLKHILRHYSNKTRYRVAQKYGETCVTEDHSIMVRNEEGALIEAKPVQMRELPFQKIEKIPPVKQVETVDLWNYLEDTSLICDSEHIWYESDWHVKRGILPKIRRFFVDGSPEMDALLSVLAAYVSEGCESDGFTLFLSTKDEMWVKEEIENLHTIFQDATFSVSKPDVYNVSSRVAFFSEVFKTLCGRNHKEKRLPNFVFHLSERSRILLLKELLRGDGYEPDEDSPRAKVRSAYHKENYFRFTTTSLILISQLSFLVTQMGMDYGITFDDRKTRAYTLYRVLKYHRPPVRTQIKETGESGYVYDLEVEDSHMFVDACGQILLHNTLLFVWPPDTVIPYPQRIIYSPRSGYKYLVFGMTMGKVRDFATGDTLTTDDYGFWHRHGQMKYHWDPGVESIYDFDYPHWLEVTGSDPVELEFYNNTGLTVIQDFSIWMFECGEPQWKEYVLPYLKGHYNLFAALGRLSEARLEKILREE